MIVGCRCLGWIRDYRVENREQRLEIVPGRNWQIVTLCVDCQRSDAAVLEFGVKWKGFRVKISGELMGLPRVWSVVVNSEALRVRCMSRASKQNNPVNLGYIMNFRFLKFNFAHKTSYFRVLCIVILD